MMQTVSPTQGAFQHFSEQENELRKNGQEAQANFHGEFPELLPLRSHQSTVTPGGTLLSATRFWSLFLQRAQ